MALKLFLAFKGKQRLNLSHSQGSSNLKENFEKWNSFLRSCTLKEQKNIHCLFYSFIRRAWLSGKGDTELLVDCILWVTQISHHAFHFSLHVRKNAVIIHKVYSQAVLNVDLTQHLPQMKQTNCVATARPSSSVQTDKPAINTSLGGKSA